MSDSSLGAPTKFSPVLVKFITYLASQGKTDQQIADIVGVAKSTLNNWKKKHPDFMDSLKDAKKNPDQEVEDSLFLNAIGFESEEEKAFYDKESGRVITGKVKKWNPGNVIAQIFWLKNRRPDRWRDNPAPAQDPSSTPVKSIKKTFEQFCEDAGYPRPYPKQIEMYAFGYKEGDPRILLGSRGYGKTDYDTILGTAYEIYCNYLDHYLDQDKHSLEETNLIISKSKTRNTAIIEEIANALVANGIELDKQNSSCLRVKGLIGKDHSVEVLTIKSSFRGRHPKRIIMDDPVTEEDTSEAMRKLVKKKYDEAYKLCKNILVIGQPAHAHDLYSELRPLLKKLEVPHGSIPELDADLKAMELAGVDSRSIEMSYHLRVPIDSGNAFAEIQYIDEFPRGDSVAFIDPSHLGKDCTGLSIARAHFSGIAVQGHVWKKAWNHCLNEIVDALRKNGVKRVCFECNGLGDQPVIMLRELLAPYGIGVVGKMSTNNKHSRIMNAGVFSKSIFLSKTSDREYTRQVTQYEYGASNDDAPDSLASLLEWIGLVKGKKV